ncbi:phage distal tail protein [Streptomyces qinzhouensis]|uniref:Phage tail protein n=1 Tax=Streptomyces qinzhouensis TaxID=2599401 RepID=A0A5B8JF37_9ACTN|nr:phage tail domain-containing protein [Streptomyces qinzhouensis]QDY78501.1 phage tail protein [Streptomyces qinzhouensis]
MATPAPPLNPDTGTDSAPASLISLDGQIQWGDLLLGPGTPYEIDRQGLTGWEDLPDADTTDADRPTTHGSWPGTQYARPRRVGGQIWLLPAPGTDPVDTLRTLRRAFGLRHTEQWLAVRIHGETLAVRARISQRVLPADRNLLSQGVGRVTVQWVATDPRRYTVEARSLTTGAPQPVTGLGWPLTWPLAWGAASVTGDLTVVNDGSAPSHPVITLRGPCSDPVITNRRTGRKLHYRLNLGVDDVLTVDTSSGAVTLNDTASRRHTAAADSSPEELFTLEPGTNEVTYRPRSSTEAATLAVRWRSAEW